MRFSSLSKEGRDMLRWCTPENFAARRSTERRGTIAFSGRMAHHPDLWFCGSLGLGLLGLLQRLNLLVGKLLNNRSLRQLAGLGEGINGVRQLVLTCINFPQPVIVGGIRSFGFTYSGLVIFLGLGEFVLVQSLKRHPGPLQVHHAQRCVRASRNLVLPLL